MVRRALLALAVSTALLWGYAKEEPPLPGVPPPPEDLSTWSSPALVQPEPRKLLPTMPEERKPTAAEKLYDYVPGGTYQALVMVGFPLDILFEQGEEMRNY